MHACPETTPRHHGDRELAPHASEGEGEVRTVPYISSKSRKIQEKQRFSRIPEIFEKHEILSFCVKCMSRAFLRIARRRLRLELEANAVPKSRFPISMYVLDTLETYATGFGNFYFS